ncbi:MAG: helix-turn-helix domain-containing protein, partial [Nanoarchaeota archaeon]
MVSFMLTLNDLNVFRTLVSGEANVSEISRKTRIAKNRVLDSLKRLSVLDLVRKTVSGRNHLYRINFLNSKSFFIINLIISEKKEKYNTKLNNLPLILDVF